MADAPAAVTGDIRSSILAELSAEPAVEAVAEPAVEAEPTDDAVEADVAEPEVEASEEDASELDEDATDEDDLDLTSADPDTQKKFDAVRKAEKRMRQSAERRDVEFAAKQREWQEKVDRVAEIDKLFARAKHDPIALLRAANVSADDFELIAQAIYAESPALQNDPKQKAAAQAKLREREKEEKQTAAEKRIADLETRFEQQKKDAAIQAEVQQYVQQVNAAATKSYPLVAALIAADPEETNDALAKAYNALAPKLNRAPKPAEVVAAYDKAQRARLQKLGIDPATITKIKATAKAANGNKPVVAAKPVANTSATDTKKAPSREDILAELAALPS